MKKALAFIFAVAVLCGSLTACSSNSNNSSSHESKNSSEARRSASLSASQTAYKNDELPVPNDFYYPQSLTYANDGSLLLIYNDMYFRVRAVKYDTELNMGKSFDIEKGETEYLSDFSQTNAGLRAVATRTEDDETVIYIHTFSDDGKITATTELGDLKGHLSTNNVHVNDVSFYGDDCLINLDNAAMIVNGKGIVTDYCDIDIGTKYTFDRNGQIICSFFKNATRIDKLRTPKDSELSENPNGSSMLKPPVMGDERYPAYLILNDGVYGMKADDEKILLLSFNSSNVKPSEITGILPFGENRFVACTENGLMLLTIRPDDYTEGRETVIVGIHNHINTINNDIATDFANHCEGYQAEFREYEYGKDDLWKDILADDSPDVYIPFDHDEIYRYVNLGALADFGTLHEKYGGISEEDFLPNIVSGMKYKSKLYSMSGYFTPELYLAKQDVLSREQAKWNYEE